MAAFLPLHLSTSPPLHHPLVASLFLLGLTAKPSTIATKPRAAIATTIATTIAATATLAAKRLLRLLWTHAVPG